jgi:D-beta-D-heptose 7-phosphate kinase/D-beta-D-heptose 1-phosphate adenosyltransferase
MNMNLLRKFAKSLDDNKKSIFIHIIGDSMIDEDYQVKVNRISPECPNVNIVQSEEFKPFRVLPGGAANVCCQLNNFNLVNRLFTFVDPAAYQIIRDYGVKYWGHVMLPDGYFVPRKKRCYERGFQVVTRWDIEKSNYGLESLNLLQWELYKNWAAFQAEPDLIIFSDYNKGLFSGCFNLFDEFKTKAITVVDPKVAPLRKWYGCTVFKPNSKEAEVLSGETDWKKQCYFFKKELKCEAVVITQEGNGVVGKHKDYFEYRPRLNIKPIDIIGAGDCFIAVFGLALVHGFSFEEAAQIAFHGGLMYVQQQRGTFGPWAFHSSGKILDNIDFLKQRDFPLVFTNGCFDLFHSGHLHTLETAKSKGKVMVAINSDESVQRLKGKCRPILPLAERMRLLASLECVDFVVSFDEDTPINLIKKLAPVDVLVKGEDWKGKEVVGAEYAKEVCYAPLIDEHSTSSIIEKIKSTS